MVDIYGDVRGFVSDRELNATKNVSGLTKLELWHAAIKKAAIASHSAHKDVSYLHIILIAEQEAWQINKTAFLKKMMAVTLSKVKVQICVN